MEIPGLSVRQFGWFSNLKIIYNLNGIFLRRRYPIKLHIKRPFTVMAAVLILVIWIGKSFGFHDPCQRCFQEADTRRLLVSGLVKNRECTSDGYRIILDHLSFQCEPGGSSALYSRIVSELNAELKTKDCIQILLSNGQEASFTMYGEGEKASFWTNSATLVDQTEVFEQARIGCEVLMHGKCALPNEATNPGQFDSRRYLAARGIVLRMSEAELRSVSAPSGGVLQRGLYVYKNLLADLRIGMQRSLSEVFGSRDAGMISSIVLGDRSGVESEEKQLFQDGGMSWLIAISSMHVTLLGMAVYRFLRRRRLSFVLAGFLSGGITASYALMTGFSVSAQRAVITFFLWLGSQIFGRTQDGMNALGAAAVFILLRQPYVLTDCAFVLSFACILSLHCLTGSVEKLIRPGRTITKKLCSSFSLWVGSLPAVLWYFYQMTPYSPLFNMILLPLMSIFLLFALAGSFAGYLGLISSAGALTQAGRLLASPCRYLLRLFELMCGLSRKLPFSVVICGRPATWKILVYYAAIILFVFLLQRTPEKTLKKKRKRYLACSAAGVLLLVLMFAVRKPPSFRYTCLDIGQGSCNLIEMRGRVCLFDAGSSSVEDVWKNRIGTTLKYYGIRRVDLVLLSHGDMDHISGIEELLENYHPDLLCNNAGDATIRQILLPELPETDDRLLPIIDSACEWDIPVGTVKSGDEIVFGSGKDPDDLRMKILSPDSGRITGNANEDCIVAYLIHGRLRILFTGDLEKDGEKMFVDAWEDSGIFTENQTIDEKRTSDQKTDEADSADQKTDEADSADQKTDEAVRADPEEDKRAMAEEEECMNILVVGHHGSRYATSSGLLEMVKPDLALISCGRNNRYNHPAMEVLERLRQAGVIYRRTDTEGAIQIFG